MKALDILILLLITTGTCWSQSTILVEAPDGSHISAHATLSGAMAAAQPGDFVYIPGGSFNMDSVKVDVELHLVGVGHNPSATVATGRSQITGSIYMLSGSDNTTIEGLYITGNIQTGTNSENQYVNSISVSRCNFHDLILSYNGSGNNETSSGFITKECIIRGSVKGGNADGVEIHNCYIRWTFDDLYGALIKNCIFFPNYDTDGFLQQNNVTFTTFNNNIFCGYISANNSANCVFNNNFFVGQRYFYSSTFEGNINLNYDYRTSGLDNATNPVFIDYPGRHYDYTANFHIQDESVCKNAGLDGSDMGVYGGDHPFKDSGLPMHPWVMSKSIAPATDADGKLKVEFQVIPQDR